MFKRIQKVNFTSILFHKNSRNFCNINELYHQKEKAEEDFYIKRIEREQKEINKEKKEKELKEKNKNNNINNNNK